MKVLFDARTITPHYPGIGRYAAGLLAALEASIPDRVTVLRTPARLRSPLDQLVTPVIAARRYGSRNTLYHSPFYLFPYLLPLPTVVTLYDLVPSLAPSVSPFAIRSSQLATRNSSFATRNSQLAIRNSQFAIRSSSFALLSRLAAERARHVITLSASARADLVRYLRLPAGKITVIPPGAPSLSASPSPRLPLPYLLYVGTSKPHKNLPRLIQAYSRLSHRTPPLVIAGPLDERYPQSQELVERLGLGERVRFLGRVPETDLASLYAHATLFVFPSLAEGFGFPVLEAMSSGVPVVCSNIPALRELAVDAAQYFDPRRIDSIALALTGALAQADLRAHLRERGLVRAQSFSWAAAAELTLEVYRRALDTRR